MDCPSINACRTFNSLNAVPYRNVDISKDRARFTSGSPSATGFASNPSKPTSNDL